MTRKKAIERAVAKTTKDLGYSKYIDGLTPLPTAAAKIASGYSYDEGRIAGLREAVREFEPYRDPDANCCGSAICKYFDSISADLLKRADKLAKKARLK